jgi:uncharacterized damage-inducible protein DinB
MDDLRYPVGPFERPAAVSETQLRQHIEDIAATPARLRAAVDGLSETQLDEPYRPGGWTVRQVVHHMADSHLNSYTRCRLALTEDTPTIKPYDEAKWAELADARTAPVETSLTLLDTLHSRWVTLLQSLTPADFERKFRHPDLGALRLDENVCLYAWHGRHHVAHITRLRDRKGW